MFTNSIKCDIFVIIFFWPQELELCQRGLDRYEIPNHLPMKSARKPVDAAPRSPPTGMLLIIMRMIFAMMMLLVIDYIFMMMLLMMMLVMMITMMMMMMMMLIMSKATMMVQLVVKKEGMKLIFVKRELVSLMLKYESFTSHF